MALAVRPSAERDLAAIAAIYAQAVETTTASFEWTAPDLPEMTRRWHTVVDAGFPWLAAESEGAVVGYAYAAPFRPRRAYDWTLETSVYVAPDSHRKGIARSLMTALAQSCEAKGARRLVAVIGDRNNIASIGFHRSIGFDDGGVLPAMGWKFGAWHDLFLMHRALGEGDTTPPEE